MVIPRKDVGEIIIFKEHHGGVSWLRISQQYLSKGLSRGDRGMKV
jgi:hypothetical protein